MMKLGRITAVDVRSIWTNEASHFTPWLAEAENLKLLGEALHLGELTLQTIERGVGDFSADIVALDEGGGEVLIENQLEPTDHRHLGQVLTYLAGLGSDAATVVWVTTRFREVDGRAVPVHARPAPPNFGTIHLAGLSPLLFAVAALPAASRRPCWCRRGWSGSATPEIHYSDELRAGPRVHALFA